MRQYKARIAKDFPNLTIQSIKHIGTGWHHIALEVNGDIVFRLPKDVNDTELATTVQYEVKILEQLQGKLPVAIPNPLYQAPDGSYFGYPKLKGEVLNTLVNRFTDNDWPQLFSDWTAIASAIHADISVDNALALGIPDFDGIDISQAEKIFTLPDIEPSVLDFARVTIQRIQTFDMDNLQTKFIHNDLQFHNLLADPQTKRISGVIDWTDVCVGPLAREFSTEELMHDSAVEQACALYEQETGTSVDATEARVWRAIEEIGDYAEEYQSGEVDRATQTLVRIKEIMSHS